MPPTSQLSLGQSQRLLFSKEIATNLLKPHKEFAQFSQGLGSLRAIRFIFRMYNQDKNSSKRLSAMRVKRR